MTWVSGSTGVTKTWSAGGSATTKSWGASSVSSYGWLPLSTESSPYQDIGVGFSVTASDFHGAYAFDDFRGFKAHDSSLSPPP